MSNTKILLNQLLLTYDAASEVAKNQMIAAHTALTDFHGNLGDRLVLELAYHYNCALDELKTSDVDNRYHNQLLLKESENLTRRESDKMFNPHSTTIQVFQN